MWSDSRNLPLFYRNTAGIREWFHQLPDTITQKINFKWLKKTNRRKTNRRKNNQNCPNVSVRASFLRCSMSNMLPVQSKARRVNWPPTLCLGWSGQAPACGRRCLHPPLTQHLLLSAGGGSFVSIILDRRTSVSHDGCIIALQRRDWHIHYINSLVLPRLLCTFKMTSSSAGASSSQ